jgi:uncharacterized protein YkwD
MKKYLLYLIIIVLAAAAWYYRQDLSHWLDLGRAKLNQAELSLSALAPNDLLPPPLRQGGQDSQSHLVQSEVIKFTNDQRAQNGGLKALKENSKLDKAAQAKLADMFKQQYFEHINPQGKGPSDLATAAGYQYVIVGENLALGNFRDSQALVEAWMNSPGHRANILNPRYQDIGVAVGKGQYQGETTWLAVQEFGTPLSACPQVNKTLEQQIKSNNAQIDTIKAQLDSLKAQIDAEQNNDRRNQLVAQYNALVGTYNSLIEQTKTLVGQYNAQIEQFNSCVKG